VYPFHKTCDTVDLVEKLRHLLNDLVEKRWYLLPDLL
jgi:hypothetical protein